MWVVVVHFGWYFTTEKKVAEIEASVLINRDIALETLVLSQTKFELNECILG